MVEIGVTKAMVMVIKNNFKEGNTNGLEEALKIIKLLWHEAMIKNMIKPLIGKNMDFINSLTWILKIHIVDNNIKMVNEVIPLLKLTIDVVESTLLGNLNIEFFKETVRMLYFSTFLFRLKIPLVLTFFFSPFQSLTKHNINIFKFKYHFCLCMSTNFYFNFCIFFVANITLNVQILLVLVSPVKK
jgi:hypothetical protein